MATSNERLVREIGKYLHATRMQKSLPQRVLAERSGVSVTAVKHLENGAGATLMTFVAVCRTLGKTGWIAELAPRGEVSPIAIMDRTTSEKPRQRARMRTVGKEVGHV